MSQIIEQKKQALRQKRLGGRTRPLPRQNRLIRDRLARLIWQFHPETVALVWPLEREIDLRSLCLHLHKAGIRVLLPYTPPRGQALTFRYWHPASKLEKGRFGTFHPTGPTGHPDIIVVPLLAFDRLGKRLGYGGGYYDRTLAAYPEVRAIGYGLASQEESEIPTDSFDRNLTAIVTENELIQFKPS